MHAILGKLPLEIVDENDTFLFRIVRIVALRQLLSIRGWRYYVIFK